MNHDEEIDQATAGFPAGEAELARHLLDLRQAPDSTLRQQVRAIPRREREGSYSRLAWVTAILAAALLLGASPPARAMLGAVETMVGQIHLVVMEGWSGRQAQPEYLESKVVTLVEARAMVPFKVATPAYLPAGLEGTEGRVSVSHWSGPMVKVQWHDRTGGAIQLTIHPLDAENHPVQTLVGSGSSETVKIKGQPAVLVQGAWDQETGVWGYQEKVVTLVWQDRGLQYRLLAAGADIPLAELAAMAESIP